MVVVVQFVVERMDYAIDRGSNKISPFVYGLVIIISSLKQQ